jgi:hypothetical protein
MNPENYKSIRNKPKRNNATSRSKSQMLAKVKGSDSTGTSKLRAIYSNKTEWATRTLPKLKE